MKLISFFLFYFSISLAGHAQEIVSPNKHIKVIISAQKAAVNKSGYPVYFNVLYKKGSEYIEVMTKSLLAYRVKTSNLPMILGWLENLRSPKCMKNMK